MKKIFTLICLLIVCGTFVGKAYDTNLPDPATLNWKNIGFGEFYDAFPYSSFKLTRQYPRNWQVEIEECVEYPGYYRVKNPYLNGYCPFTDNLGQGNDFYINACDPDGVYIPPQDLGFTLNSSLGNIFVASKAGLDLRNGMAKNIEECKQAGTVGTLYDNEINIPSSLCWMMLPNYADGDYYLCTYDFTLKLPGAGNYKVSVDYTDKLWWSDMDDCTETDSYDFLVAKTDDVAEMRYVLSYSVINGVVKEISEEVAKIGIKCQPGILTVKNGYHNDFVGRATVYLVGLDSEGNVRCADYAFVDFVSDSARGPWKKLGTTNYDDVIICSIYENADSPTCKVEVEESESEPGLFRLKNVYSQKGYWTKQEIGNTHNHGNRGDSHDCNHYVYINASDPDAVYIEPSPIGFADNDGSILLESLAYIYIEAGYPVELVASYLGTYKDGRITIPAEAIMGCQTQYDNGNWYTANWYPFVVDIPQGVPGEAGVEEIEDPNAPVYYFNLQGTRVENPQPGTPVIRVQGNRSQKLIIR